MHLVEQRLDIRSRGEPADVPDQFTSNIAHCYPDVCCAEVNTNNPPQFIWDTLQNSGSTHRLERTEIGDQASPIKVLDHLSHRPAR